MCLMSKSELSKCSRSNLTSDVCDHFILNSVSGDLTFERGDDVLGCQIAQLVYVRLL